MVTLLPAGDFGVGRAGFFLLTSPLDPSWSGRPSFIDAAKVAVVEAARGLPWPLGIANALGGGGNGAPPVWWALSDGKGKPKGRLFGMMLAAGDAKRRGSTAGDCGRNEFAGDDGTLQGASVHGLPSVRCLLCITENFCPSFRS